MNKHASYDAKIFLKLYYYFSAMQAVNMTGYLRCIHVLPLLKYVNTSLEALYA